VLENSLGTPCGLPTVLDLPHLSRPDSKKAGVTGLDAFHAEDLAEELVTARLS
jgi:hypothetical protein